MTENQSIPIEVIDLGSCDNLYTVRHFTVPFEQVNEVGIGVLLERRAVGIELLSEKYGNRILECVVGSTRAEKANATFMDMETWAEVRVIL